MTLPTVVLDPGHGGTRKVGGSSPNNARGPGGLLEKDLTLDLARRLRPLLSNVARVALTRDADTNLGLAERARAARDHRAALFLSVHMNGFHDAAVDGTEVWVARQANRRSRDFAQTLLAQLADVTGVRNRGVRESDLGVLLPSRHANETGACLAEVSFLTNPDQERRLRDESYRQRIAQAMANAIEQQLAAPAASQSLEADAWSEALEGPPPLADWIKMEFVGVKRIKGSREELPFYLLMTSKDSKQKAHFELRITNTSPALFSSPTLFAPLVLVRLSKKRTEGEDQWDAVELGGQKAGTQYKRMKEKWAVAPQQSKVWKFAIDHATLEKAYNLEPGNPHAEIRVEIEASAGLMGKRVRQAKQLRFALVKPVELLLSSPETKVLPDVTLWEDKYREEYWTQLPGEVHREASTKPRSLEVTVETSVTYTDANEVVVQNSVAESKGTQTGIEIAPKVDWTLGKLAALGRQFGLSLGVKFSHTWSQSVATEVTNTLRKMSSRTQTTKMSHQFAFEIPPVTAGKQVRPFLCPTFEVHKVKAVRFDGPNEAGQATARTEEFQPVLMFKQWNAVKPVVIEDAKPVGLPTKPAPARLPAPMSAPVEQAGEITFEPAVITVSAKRRAELLKKAGWRQVSIAITVKNFRGEPMRGRRVFAEFQSPGVATITEGGDAQGGSISWAGVWLKPEGTVRVMAVPTGGIGSAALVPEGVTHYRVPERGLLKFDATQDGEEVAVTAETSQEAVEKIGVKGSAGVDFEVVQIGGEVSGESERKKGSSRAVTWKVVLPTSTFELAQVGS